MSIDLIFAIIFYSLLVILFVVFRKKFTVQSKIFVMYKTKLGLKLMDRMAGKFPRAWKILGIIGVAAGFAGMAGMLYLLVRGLITLILQPTQPATLGLVLPGIKIPGSPVFVPFWYGIISIFIVATIHEFFHGVYSRLYKVDVKSSGVAFLGPILAAFVEPEEEQLKKRSKLAQLSVFAAGALSNMLTAGIVLLIMLFIMVPLTNSIVEVSVSQVEKDFPLFNAGLQPGELIREINSKQVTNVPSFTEAIKDIKPGDNIMIKTDKNEYAVTAAKHPSIEDKGYLGVIVAASVRESIKEKYGSFLSSLPIWLYGLFFWIFSLSLGIGLVNLLPLGPIDGGRMFHLAAMHFIKDEKKTNKLFGLVSILCLVLVVLNLTFPYLRKLF